jgi:hypothetical protein
MAGARPAALLAAPLLALLCLRAVAAQPCTRLGGATNLAPATNLTCASGWQYQLPAAGVCAGSCRPSSAALSSCTYTAPTAAWCNAGNLTGHCPAQCRAAAVVQRGADLPDSPAVGRAAHRPSLRILLRRNCPPTSTATLGSLTPRC